MTSPVVNIHASCVVLADAAKTFEAPHETGLLLLGESGTGKSDLALRLIALGAVLVADDRCDLFLKAGSIHARPPRTLAGLIEIRGVGLVELRHVPETPIGLVVRLVPAHAIARLPESARYQPPAPLLAPSSVWPPEIAIDPFQASAPAKIAAAAAAFANSRLRI